MQLNEGLEKLGADVVINGWDREGNVFSYTAIESVRLPSTLKRIEAMTFSYCRNLRNVELLNGVEYIGKECFYGSGITEIMFPAMLKEIDDDAFYHCHDCKVVWVGEGCPPEVRKCVGYPMVILPAETMVGGLPLQDLR